MSGLQNGQISFIEIGAASAEATAAFFAAVFDWPQGPGPWLQTPEMRAGVHGDDPAPQIYVFFHADDLEAAARRVRAAGGEAGSVQDQGEFGCFINCKGPGGIQFGLRHPPAPTGGARPAP